MKEIKLKNGEILTITFPTLDDAQELADFANAIRCQSRYINHGLKYADGTYAKLILMQKDLK